MPAFTNTFGGTNIYPADVSYRAVSLTANVVLSWPTEMATNTDVVASIMDVTPSAGSLTITMPPADQVSVGQTTLIFNAGSFAFVVLDNDGNTIQSIAPGLAWQLYLTGNTTNQGTWRQVQYGVGTSSPSAAALAGYGLKAIATTLNQSMPVTVLSTSYTMGATDRAQALVWNGGAGTFTLPSASSVGNDWFINIRNAGTGGLTIAPTGGQLINGASSVLFNPSDSATLMTDGTAWYTIGYGQNAIFAFDFVSIDLTSQTSPYTLAGSNLNRVSYQFSGVLTANMQIIVPSTVQQYWVRNTTSGAYTLTVKTASGSGVAVVQNGAAILYSNGTDVVQADTASLSVPISITQGGTGATTSGTALVNLGGTSLGIGLFTASTAAVARGALGAAASGANSDITSLSGLTTSLSVAQGGTGQTTYTNGQLLIGNTTGNTLAKTTLTAGTGINITNGAGTITIAGTGPDTFPSAGIAYSTGTAWGTSYTTTGTGTTLALSVSPAFTGTPTAPTAAGGTNTTQLATTAFVAASFAPINSPALTGVPTAPTAAGGTSTTQIATTAYVVGTAFSSVLPGQTGNAGKYVTTNGTLASWSFVDLAAGVTGTLPVANGGTGATTLTGVVKGNGTGAFTAGTVALASEVSGTLPVANGGTGATTLTLNNVLLGNGTSALQTVAPGTAGNVLTSSGTSWSSTAPSGSSLTAVASGSLSNGSTVVVNSDGTVSAVVARSGSPFVGAESIFRSATTSSISSAYDSTNQKVVIAYQDGGNSNFGYAVVGTVSGTAITFGTPVRFSTGAATTVLSTSVVYDTVNQKTVICYSSFDGTSTYATNAVVGTVSGTSISFGTVNSIQTATINPSSVLSATYEINAQKVVLCWIYNNGAVALGQAAVGTVSGTSITFGTINTFKSTNTSTPIVVYDASVQRVVVAYIDTASSNFGTAAIGTVSGTTISFGTPVVFKSASTSSISIAYDSVNQRVAISYVGTSNFGTTIIGTSSTTSISFGTEVVFNSASTSAISSGYEQNLQKVVIAFRQGSTGFGSAIVGTVSGTSISFGSIVTFNAASTQVSWVSYAANVQDMVISFQDTGNLSYGTSVVFQASGTNLTASNYIGISNAAYTNGQTATIQVAGAVDDAQSGLTPGLLYYVQPSGALATTAGFPSVVAGTAVAAAKIIVKG